MRKWLKRPNLGKKNHMKRVGPVAPCIGPEFKPQYLKKKKNTWKMTQIMFPIVHFLRHYCHVETDSVPWRNALEKRCFS
jgi:hypothetical protein